MAETIVHCSFCNTPSNELPKGSILKGKQAQVYICTPCVTKGYNTVSAKQASVKDTSDAALPKPVEIKALLDEYVIAQDRAKKDIAVAVYNHYKRREVAKASKANGVEISKSNILLLGPSGTGKTELFRSISRALKVPFSVQDCTALTQTGYVGADPEDIIRGLVESASGNVERAEWGIVLLDEFDKLARKSGRSASGYRDVTGEGVQQALLKLIEGDRIPVTRGRGKNASVSTVGADGQVKSNVDVIDTTNILFVAAGSFAGIEDILDRRINRKARVGFGGEDTRRVQLSSTETYERVTSDDILEFGIIPELLGRLPILTSTYALSDEDMVRILTEPKHAVVKQYQALMAMDGIDLSFDKEALLSIASRANAMPVGARGLRTILEGILRTYMFEGPSDPNLKSLVVTKDLVESSA